jgi:AbrB family looped-hinge helix DNA binding protein
MIPQGGFLTVDDKGRVSLPKPVRGALDLQPGSSVAYVLVDGMLLLLPQDDQLVDLMQRAERALAASGLTVDDFLAELPNARAEVVAETYSAEFLREMAELHEQLRSPARD